MGNKNLVSPYSDIPDSRSLIKKYGIKILFLIFGMILGLFIDKYITSLGSNEIGLTLINNGILILIISILMIIGSQHEKSKLDLIWENYPVENKKNFIFRLLEKSYAILAIQSIKGIIECKLSEFYSIKDNDAVTRIFYSKDFVEGELFTSPVLELPKGEYCLSIHCEKSFLSFGYLFYYKPYEVLYSIGLSLTEVSIPLVITGLILLMYNQTI